MSGILRLESLTKGNTLKQGDKTPLKYRLFDADGEQLNIAGKSAKVRLVYPDFLTIGYEKDGLTVAQDDTVTFTIDSIIPSRIYHVEIIVDDKFIFPSLADEAKFTVDKSSLGTETNIIEIVGKDILIREVKTQVDTELQPLVTSLESAEQAEAQRVSNETVRVSAEAQRKTDHANRSAELAGKADKVVIKNLVENGDFSNGLTDWYFANMLTDNTKIVDGKLHVYGQNSGQLDYPSIRYPTYTVAGHKHYFYIEISEMASNSVKPILQDRNRHIFTELSNGIHSKVVTIESGQTLGHSYLNHITPTGSVIDYKVDNLISIDLTETFGAGNEPSKKEMDKLINITGYIDGEYVINNKEMLGYLMNGKANKKQEDWITPTLLNGWVDYGDILETVGYMKDDFGFVHIKGVVKGGSVGQILFTLPQGYRPLKTQYLPCISSDILRTLEVKSNGAVFISPSASNVWIALNGIHFKVEG